MLANLLRRGGPLLASALVLAAAVASLFGSAPVQQLVGSAWFLSGVGLIALASLLATVRAANRRSRASAVQHMGLVVALAGVVVNQTSSRSGYLFLEQGAGVSNFSLSRDLRRIEELPEPLALDSVTYVSARAFRPAPVAWVSTSDSRSRPVTHNRPLRVAGRQVLLSQIAEPGFLNEYEIGLAGDEYLLLHNQVIEPSAGFRIWSFAYDADVRRVGLMLGAEQRWLAIGDSAMVNGGSLKLLSATFAANTGAIFIVNDARFRFVVFIGFGLMLLGLAASLFRRYEP